ncbi:restriction endonuclease subunit M [Histophilus somni]|uniref:restriction endonuclease subunit S n=1 Tax=Histophilus somni TaxID=731 RepID=UPI000B3B6321|nr:restriction endonuclease subunit S [Histophilus somni]ARU66514.1 restriction endonuclease subunit M [Histophilus somni]ARU68388.1 restriction endonuclease subunit M [Histophilus somni]ARU70267.1 restriction endonuclease subunit M [Histophilus somni]ARU72142.1 restriction endonuclease subunit M [Histophilus somni]ARU76167.1 restriction endonuclease subunit M [Histophilus somni]
MLLSNIVEISSGQAQFRLSEVSDPIAPVYTYYGQANLEQDLYLSDGSAVLPKEIKTFDKITNLLSTGDVIFSLISGKATIVSKQHQGFLYTQNYVKLIPKNQIDANYLVYLLNENAVVKKQLSRGLQGSQVLKYTTNQLKSLRLPKLPHLSEQRLMGEIYLKQQKLAYLKQRIANLEKLLVLHQLQKRVQHD